MKLCPLYLEALMVNHRRGSPACRRLANQVLLQILNTFLIVQRALARGRPTQVLGREALVGDVRWI